MTTPRQEGYYMPAEWHPHTACWMAWAGLEEAYSEAPGGSEEYFAEAKVRYGEVARAISKFEPVNMIVNKEDMEEAQRICGPDITIIEGVIDDGWFRDSGPTFVINKVGDVAGVNWIFTGWGDKYIYEKDAKIAAAILDREGIKRFDCPLATEGGAIHVDGEGTLLSTQSCLCNKNRNPDLSLEEVEHHLKEYLNLEKIIWLNGNVTGDETDGHVDGIASFVRPGVVMATATSHKNHPDYDVINENLEILKSATDAKGRNLEVVEVPNPFDHTEKSGYYTGIYINFYMANGGIVLPSSGSPEDDIKAVEIFKREFPSHEVVLVNSTVIWYGGGNIHCITQQQPAPY